MNTEKQSHYTKEDYGKFFEALFGETKELFTELDYVKMTETDRPYIYFTHLIHYIQC